MNRYMSYCRFENTVDGLRDCYENINEIDKTNEFEMRARVQLLELCKRILEEAEDMPTAARK